MTRGRLPGVVSPQRPCQACSAIGGGGLDKGAFPSFRGRGTTLHHGCCRASGLDGRSRPLGRGHLCALLGPPLGGRRWRVRCPPLPALPLGLGCQKHTGRSVQPESR